MNYLLSQCETNAYLALRNPYQTNSRIMEILPRRRICRIPPVQESSRIIHALTVGARVCFGDA